MEGEEKRATGPEREIAASAHLPGEKLASPGRPPVTVTSIAPSQPSSEPVSQPLSAGPAQPSTVAYGALCPFSCPCESCEPSPSWSSCPCFTSFPPPPSRYTAGDTAIFDPHHEPQLSSLDDMLAHSIGSPCHTWLAYDIPYMALMPCGRLKSTSHRQGSWVIITALSYGPVRLP